MANFLDSLVEVDTLEAVVIIDNEIDILSTVQPSTVKNAGRMPNLSTGQPASIRGRGDVSKEMPMEAICCGAHGLSVLVVRGRQFSTNTKFDSR
jgi:7,8-dihydropterin-6-yl-methyl-4-(beta-D-ribofuranosyl)aminobenzene 5'-phosphate synthase